MIPYQELVSALVKWRTERGLHVTSGAKEIAASHGELSQPHEIEPQTIAETASVAAPPTIAEDFDEATVMTQQVPEGESFEQVDSYDIEAPSSRAEQATIMEDHGGGRAQTLGEESLDIVDEVEEASAEQPMVEQLTPQSQFDEEMTAITDSRNMDTVAEAGLFDDDEQTAMVDSLESSVEVDIDED